MLKSSNLVLAIQLAIFTSWICCSSFNFFEASTHLLILTWSFDLWSLSLTFEIFIHTIALPHYTCVFVIFVPTCSYPFLEYLDQSIILWSSRNDSQSDTLSQCRKAVIRVAEVFTNRLFELQYFVYVVWAWADEVELQLLAFITNETSLHKTLQTKKQSVCSTWNHVSKISEVFWTHWLG
jgi:hypothetical protein